MNRFDLDLPLAATRLIQPSDTEDIVRLHASIAEKIAAIVVDEAPPDLAQFDCILGGIWPILCNMTMPKNLTSFHVGNNVEIIRKYKPRDLRWYGVEFDGRLSAELLAHKERWLRTNGGDDIKSRSACGELNKNLVRSWINQAKNAGATVRLYISTIEYSLRFVLVAAVMMLAVGGNAIILIDRIDVEATHALAAVACFFGNTEIVHSLGHIYVVYRGRTSLSAQQKAILLEGTATATSTLGEILPAAYAAMADWYAARATFELTEWQKSFNY